MISIINMNISARLKEIGGQTVFSVLTSNRSTCHKTDSGYAITFRFYDMHKPEHKESKVYLIIDDSGLTALTEDKRIISLLHQDAKIDGYDALYSLFSGMVEDDINELENLENKIMQIEDELLNGSRPDKDILKKIVTHKHRVLKIKRYYAQLGMICETLGENSDGIIRSVTAKRFRLISAKTERLLQEVMHLYECIIQVREVYQSQIDIEQNNVTRDFTVITTIFFPLTLIVGWYGMNLKMPEFSWNMGYLFVILLSIVVIAASVIIFKIKKWF